MGMLNFRTKLIHNVPHWFQAIIILLQFSFEVVLLALKGFPPTTDSKEELTERRIFMPLRLGLIF